MHTSYVVSPTAFEANVTAALKKVNHQVMVTDLPHPLLITLCAAAMARRASEGRPAAKDMEHVEYMLKKSTLVQVVSDWRCSSPLSKVIQST